MYKSISQIFSFFSISAIFFALAIVGGASSEIHPDFREPLQGTLSTNCTDIDILWVEIRLPLRELINAEPFKPNDSESHGFGADPEPTSTDLLKGKIDFANEDSKNTSESAYESDRWKMPKWRALITLTLADMQSNIIETPDVFKRKQKHEGLADHAPFKKKVKITSATAFGFNTETDERECTMNYDASFIQRAIEHLIDWKTGYNLSSEQLPLLPKNVRIVYYESPANGKYATTSVTDFIEFYNDESTLTPLEQITSRK